MKNVPHFDSNQFADLKHLPLLPPVYLISVGMAAWRKGSFFERNNSSIFGIEYVVSGTMNFSQNGREYECTSGMVYFLRKGLKHRYSAASQSGVLKRYAVFDGLLCEQLFRATRLWARDVLTPANPSQINILLKRAFHLVRAKPPDFAQTLSVLAYELVMELSRANTPDYPPIVQDGLTYLQRNISNHVSTRQLCTHLGVSKTHLNRLFSEHLGLSPQKYAISIRMAWARQMLENSARSVKEISGIVGYDDPLYFSAQFKKHAGMSPSVYRNQF